MSTWTVSDIRPVVLTWAADRNGVRHECPHCHIGLLTGEDPGFCCGPRGTRLQHVAPLPPLPPQYAALINHPNISQLSRRLNLIFSFAALESTVHFPLLDDHNSFVALEGRLFHRIRPSHQNSPIKWLIYDGFHPASTPHPRHAAQLPPDWIPLMQSALLQVNPFVRSLLQLSTVANPIAHVVLLESTAPELAACLSFENTALAEYNPRRIIISRSET
ncbi:hypothetical protein BC629DRAFT_1650501, partial [Irpex lacteus]